MTLKKLPTGYVYRLPRLMLYLDDLDEVMEALRVDGLSEVTMSAADFESEEAKDFKAFSRRQLKRVYLHGGSLTTGRITIHLGRYSSQVETAPDHLRPMAEGAYARLSRHHMPLDVTLWRVRWLTAFTASMAIVAAVVLQEPFLLLSVTAAAGVVGALGSDLLVCRSACEVLPRQREESLKARSELRQKLIVPVVAAIGALIVGYVLGKR